MNRTLFAAPVAALALLAASPASAQLTIDLSLKLSLTAAPWRSSSGHEGLIQPKESGSFTGYGFTGYRRQNGKVSVEELNLGATTRDQFAGDYARIEGGQIVEEGTYTLRASSRRMIGKTTIAGQERSFVLCQRPSTGPATDFKRGFWTRLISAKRISGGRGASVVVELQYNWLDDLYFNYEQAVGTFVAINNLGYTSILPKDATGATPTSVKVDTCGTLQLHFTFDDLPVETKRFQLRTKYEELADFDLDLPLEGGPQPTPAPTTPSAPEPLPSPAPAPGPIPAPTPAPPPAPNPGPPGVPAGAGSFAAYGPWQYKVDELTRGPDGHFQLVFTVRNASRQRLPFSITDFDATLIDAGGRGIRRLGNLHAASVTGPASALERIGMSYLEPGDQMRGRVLFLSTKGWNPVTLRIKEPVRSLVSNDFSMR